MNAISRCPHRHFSTFIVKTTSSDEKKKFHKTILIATF